MPDDLTLPLWEDTPTAALVARAEQSPPRAEQSPPGFGARLAVPVSYQGGKQRLAADVVDLWWSSDGPPPERFVELCCGSGAVSIEMVNRGYPVEAITMVDAGPWGLFWQAVGAGTFNTEAFEAYLDALPTDPALIQGALQEMARQPVGDDAAEVFPILQAGSFGAKALWISDNPDGERRWANTSFRSYWLPTATSSRRSPVNPMMPMPATLRGRVLDVVEAMQGVDGRCADASTIPATISPTVGDAVVYMDPPYAGTTAYGYGLNIPEVARAATALGTVYVSEGIALTDEAHLLSTGRAKGGISGAKKVAHNEEWVSIYRP